AAVAPAAPRGLVRMADGGWAPAPDSS
ncbi:MAG: hypothetical protein JWP49_923, partial [Phenylobacterium sp.]|nr:hypothetical protein [Phenylobacterium sp.]